MTITENDELVHRGRETTHQPPHDQGNLIDWSVVMATRNWMLPRHDETSTIARRFAPGTRAATVTENPTGNRGALDDPHWFPNGKRVTPEYDHDMVADAAALATRFGDEVEAQL